MRKICTVAWRKICFPYNEGGLGVKSLKSLNEAAILKLSFEMLALNKDWVVFFRNRFCHMHKPRFSYVKSSIWPGIKLFLKTVYTNSIWRLGDGKLINFWLDKWLSQPLVDLMQIPPNFHQFLKSSVAEDRS